MHRVIDISLAGHAGPYRLHEDAFDRLRAYLDQAEAGLDDDADRAEIIGDLELAIGDKLTARLGQDRRVVDLADVLAVLDEVGAVESTRPVGSVAAAQLPTETKRRLYRIREGQAIAGVCTGIAAYADISVDVVRWVVVGLTIVTAGVFGFVYIALVLILRVMPTQEAFMAAQRAPSGGPG